MILNQTQIDEIVHGALKTVHENGRVGFLRFTEKQLAHYAGQSELSRLKAYASAGVSLDFRTDSDSFSFDFVTDYGSSRKYWFIDGQVDGVTVYHIGNENAERNEIGRFEMQLPSGEHRVTVRFTGISRFELSSLALDEGASLIPIEKKLKMLLLGDSITQGYDAYHPTMHYANRTVDAFDAEAINQAIGGEVFCADILPDELADAFSPDVITVAYGTNDWGRRSADLFDANANAFFERLRALYPKVRVFCLLPIWRGDLEKEHDPTHRTFDGMRASLTAVAERYGAAVIDTLSFVPHLSECFWDEWLHPNDLGFLPFGECVIKALGQHLNTL